MTLSIADDYLIFDGTETVTYYARTSDAAFANGVAVAYALRERGNRQEVNSPLVASKRTETWHFWSTPLGTVTPKPGDKFTDGSGNAWLVQSVDNTAWRTRYDVEALKVR